MIALVIAGPVILVVVAIAVVRALARRPRPNGNGWQWSKRHPLGGPIEWSKGPVTLVGNGDATAGNWIKFPPCQPRNPRHCPHGVDWDGCPDCCH